MKRIKIGQLGVGHLHAYKYGTLTRHADIFDLVGVAEDDPHQRALHGGHAVYQGSRWLGSEELLATPGLDAVLVETEEHHLIPAALRCIRAGKHIHLDKPGGESLPAFGDLLAEAGHRALTVQMGYMYRNSPAIRFCIDAVRSGLLGRISTFDAVMSRCDGEAFRQVLKTFRAGATYVFLCHLVDLAVILFGEPRRIIPLSTCTRDDGVVDNGLAVMEFGGGLTATLRSSIVEAGGFQRRNVVICGDRGSIEVRPLELMGDRAGGRVFLTLLQDTGEFKKGTHEIPQPPLEDRYDGQLLEFARIVRGEIANPYPHDHEYLVQRCVLDACSDWLGPDTSLHP